MYRGMHPHEEEEKQPGDRWQASREVSEQSGEPGASRDWTSPSNPTFHGHTEATRAVWPHGAINGQAQYDDQRPRTWQQGPPQVSAESQSHRRDHHAWLVAHTRITTTKHPPRRHATPDTSTLTPHPLWGIGRGLDGDRGNTVEEPRQATWSALDGVREPWAATRAGSSDFEAQDGAWPTSSHSPLPAEHGTFDVLASQRGQQNAMGSSRVYSWSSLANQQLADGDAFAASELSCVPQTGGDSDEDDEEDGDDEADERNSDDIAAEAESPVPKVSRYLREMDRRVILDRLAHGEKQVTLAKEFNVSRAAICNLFKHRHEVLARSGENPLAKHPKKKKNNLSKAGPAAKRQKRAQSESDVAAQSSRSPGTESNVATQSSRSSSDHGGRTSSRSPTGTLNVMATAALQLLLSALSDRTRSLQDFKRNSDRVLWLLLEEALAHVPVKEIKWESDDAEPASPRYEAESPACAISMEPRTINATPMLDIFQLMEPHQPSGIATVSTASTERSSLTVEIADTDLPKSLRGYNVFVLNVVAASGEVVCSTIERLLSQFDVAEDCVTVVALFVSSEVVAMVQCKYPLVKIVTARIDSAITRRRIASTPVDLILHRVRDAYSSERPLEVVGARPDC